MWEGTRTQAHIAKRHSCANGENNLLNSYAFKIVSMFEINKHNPFPSVLRGDKIKGAYCEVSIDNGLKSRYVIIRPKPYDAEINRHRFKIAGIEIEDIQPGWSHLLRLLGRDPKHGVPWIYLVQTFVVDGKFQGNQSSLIKHMQDFLEYAFDDINDVLDFCEEKFDVSATDFGKDWETNYPQW